MAYDESLAKRIRKLIPAQAAAAVSEKKMFGGLAFLVHGNMAIAASGQGGLLVRVDPAQTDALLASTKATIMTMRGRNMAGWLRVSTEDVTNDSELLSWVELGISYAESLEPK
ncbi:MAG TPA: TfoX/Sxy family protein [Candidatus Saccharimonadales bacterium]|nr:TfoX/Sxy family protein [Candidatus Saccharimonadales bacterium]